MTKDQITGRALLTCCQRTLCLQVTLALALIAHPVPLLAEAGPNNDAREIANQIDEALQGGWDSADVKPNPLCDDETFIRRAYLDLVGVIPPVSAVRQFRADDSTDKRHQLVDRLIASPRHATHLANTWRRILLPDGFPAERSQDAIGMQRWLRDRFVQNIRYDRIVGDFLTATGGAETGPVLFYQALDVAPEKLASATARSFLGIQIQCAQCHDHPFDDWTQHDFWEYAAFFAQVRGEGGMNPNARFRLRDANFGEVTLPEDDEPVLPAFPGDDETEANPADARRLQLSIWLSSGNNPYLARATANRVWSLMFGQGIVEPVDDLSEMNEPSHPEVLQLLADAFVASEFNLNELFRIVAYTEAYQRSSMRKETDKPAASPFASMAIKTLTAEQLFDSISISLQNNPKLSENEMPINSLMNSIRREFLVKMNVTSPTLTDYGAGLQQTLHMMNSGQLSNLISDEDEGILPALTAPFFDDRQRLETAFLATLSRNPTEKEQELFLGHLSAAKNQDSAWSDVLWALLNSAEYQLNH